jgi:hypothetical protein
MVLDAIIDRIEDPITFFHKHPKKFRSDVILNGAKNPGDLPDLTRALIFDSVYDPYK